MQRIASHQPWSLVPGPWSLVPVSLLLLLLLHLLHVKERRRRLRWLLCALHKHAPVLGNRQLAVQVWRVGELTWVVLGGEVVVDYALRLKRNLGSSHTWVSAYCNDVMAYIPSARVLREGGYEGATAMVYYGQPTTWSSDVEQQVVEAVMSLLSSLPAAQAGASGSAGGAGIRSDAVGASQPRPASR